MLGILYVLPSCGPDGGAPTCVLIVETDAGGTTVVPLPDRVRLTTSGIAALHGQRVRITGSRRTRRDGTLGLSVRRIVPEMPPTRRTRALPQRGIAPPAIALTTRPTPWLTLLFNFPELPPADLPPAFFDQRMSNDYPGLGHYFREVSLGQVDLSGSLTRGWFPLEREWRHYAALGNVWWLHLREDALATAQRHGVAPDGFYGYNFVFNGGVPANFGVPSHFPGPPDHGYTWTPVDSWTDHHTIAHEMGHAYGMNVHSRESAWDLISAGACGSPNRINHPLFQCVDCHPIAYHKTHAGWLPEALVYTHTEGERSIILERLALPETPNYMLARIPLGDAGQRCYTVEARRRHGYDKALPGDGVLIHMVDETRGDWWAQLVIDPVRASPVWRPVDGQRQYYDEERNVLIAVEEETASGYRVRIARGLPRAPRNVRVGAVTANSIEIRWDDQSSDETEFSITFAPAGTSNWGGVTVPADTRAWTHTDLAPGSPWSYWVRACNRLGCSEFAGGITATTAT